MTDSRRYPDDHAHTFPRPPREFSDDTERDIEFRSVDWETDRDALVAFYVAFDPADRAQGVPPIEEPQIRQWLSTIDDGVDVAAWHADHVVGHATLVPDNGDAYELAIFVLDTYQGAGIGTELLKTLLGAGQAADVDRVWLTVERWNHAAVTVYERVGFETTTAANFELEMGIKL